MRFMRTIYDWVINLSKKPNGSRSLALISFSEASFFPIPPDIVLIPMVIANKVKALWFAFICTISSVLGGILGYLIGAIFYSTIGIIIVNYYGLENQFAEFELLYNKLGFWIVFGAGFTPFPFKFITIASGFFNLNFFLFVFVAIIGRGLRFFLLAILLKIFGNFIENFINKYFNLLVILFFILLISGFILLKYL